MEKYENDIKMQIIECSRMNLYYMINDQNGARIAKIFFEHSIRFHSPGYGSKEKRDARIIRINFAIIQMFKLKMKSELCWNLEHW